MEKLKGLADRLKRTGYGKLPKSLYPRAHFVDYMIAVDPEAWDEFRKWFDQEVRGK